MTNESSIKKLKEYLLKQNYPNSSLLEKVEISIEGKKIDFDLIIKDADSKTILAVFKIYEEAPKLHYPFEYLVDLFKYEENIPLIYAFIDDNSKLCFHQFEENYTSNFTLNRFPDFSQLWKLYRNSNYKRKSKRETTKLKKQFFTYSGILSSGIVSIISIVLVINLFINFTGSEQSQLNKYEYETLDKINDLNSSFEKIRTKIDLIESSQIQNNRKNENAKLIYKIETVKQKVNNLEVSLKKIEDAITTDPSKSLAIPILRKDMDYMEKLMMNELNRTNAEFGRFFDILKWLIGSIFTLAITILGYFLNSKTLKNRKDE
ncbi:hypothetical protein [Leptospira vanthielii]|uniref:Uncharacterized protein n=1 Tax=Leptospira vanthielii serovar Holland str. Waz Holland = ATCC 700522 TaxID=1218591 RepID=N1WH71_9LEPT|nr:hypothetical protein [Leptospira vanthielii]EMY71206.1 hypothetical protein LEP1GSC199_0624 [Leptospira vanthielii serovar Holland str. Waz Holland = ATCC 700522]